MPTGPLNRVIPDLLADLGPGGAGATDAELLARFLRSRDDDALAALVRRHAPMVWGVCRRILPNRHDAEDAFQATFLVLVRKAGGVPGQVAANWLYGVARQTAVRLRATAAKRRRREAQVATMPEPTAAEGHDADVQSVLDEELGHLPDHYRVVVVLCDLEGLTRREAARQLGIPEGSVASRLARARALLARRLARRGVVFSGGSAVVLAAGSASASAPPELVASTVRAASRLAAGRAAGVSAKVAALTGGVVKAMFVTRLKGVLAAVLVVAALAGAAGLLYPAQAGEQSMANEEHPAARTDEKTGGEKSAPPKRQPAKTDQEHLVGNWFIMNDDSLRKGEMWVITEDSILMHAKSGGLNTHHYGHRLDASKNPKQIDITVTRGNGPPVGLIKGIYLLDGDELRLSLGAIDKERPVAFPAKPGPGEVLILQRSPHGATPPKPKAAPPAKTDQERMAGYWLIVKNDGSRNRKGEDWLIGDGGIVMYPNHWGFRILMHFHRLDPAKSPKQIDITVTKTNKEHIGVIKGIYAFAGDNELRLCLGEIGRDRPTEFAGKPGQSEFLILQRVAPGTWPLKTVQEALIDKVLAAHGGEDKLNKLQFAMTVKHSNGETQHYFVRPPRNFRWETTHRDRTGKRIVILFPQGRRWWSKEPGEDAKEFRPTGAEAPVAYWLDYVKFFGPRQVLRLKDADHMVTLLDEEVKIGDRAAVGVEVAGPGFNRKLFPPFNRKMYFDKETHLLLKSGAISYSDYKTFDGIPVAQKEDDGHFMPEVTDFKAVDKFDPKLFEQP
jgi:RNA polymerase sigma factor (sigma-70 family)